MPVQPVHPPSPCGRSNPGAAIYRDGTIERRQQAALATARLIVRARKVEERRVTKCGYLLYDPSLTANDNPIAGREGHACVMATVIPWKIYPQCRAFPAVRLSEWQ